MPELTLKDIDKIIHHVRREEITFSHLPDDLIDHICCEVEEEMEVGITFGEAYKKVRNKIGSRRLKEIQEETLYAIDSKYRKMKTTMKISGIAGTVMFGFAALFKIQHWPGAGIMLTLGAILLSLVFMPSALWVLWKETRNRYKLFLLISVFLTAFFFIGGTLFKIQHWTGAGVVIILAAASGTVLFLPSILAFLLKDPERKDKRGVYITGAIGFICFVLGLLFKVQHWHYALVLMVGGIIILGVIALPWFAWINWKDEEHINPAFLFIIIGSVAIIMPAALITLNLQYSFESHFFPYTRQENTQYNYMFWRNSGFIQNYRDSATYMEMTRLHEGTMKLIGVISEAETKMVQESEGKPGNPAIAEDQIRNGDNSSEIIYRSLHNPFSTTTPRNFLMPGCETRKRIESASREYIAQISGINVRGDKDSFKLLVDPSGYLPDESKMGTPYSMMTGLHSLAVLKNNILTAEMELLTIIAGKK